MRRLRKSAACLAALVPPAVVGVTAVVAGAGEARGEARGLLGVTVEVIAPCAASLADGGVTVDPACSALRTPMAVQEEAVAPPDGSGGAAAAMVAESEGGLRYITVLY